MARTDEEVAEQQERVEELRRKLAESETSRAQNVQEIANETTYLQLQAEGDRIEAELARSEAARVAELESAQRDNDRIAQQIALNASAFNETKPTPDLPPPTTPTSQGEGNVDPVDPAFADDPANTSEEVK